MTYGRPSDDSPGDWYTAAKNIDQNRTLGLGRGCYAHEKAKLLRVKRSQRTWGKSQVSSFAFIGSSVTVSLTKDLPHVLRSIVY